MFEFKSMRNSELMRDYRHVLKTALSCLGFCSQEVAIKKMLAECRPRYDVTFDYALRMMQLMLRDGKSCPAKGLKVEMWKEIACHVNETMERRHCSLHKAVALVLAEKRASRYFLSYKQAAKIIHYEQQKGRHSRPCRA